MAGSSTKIESDARSVGSANERLAVDVLRQFAAAGGREVCLCAGSRNAAFVEALSKIRALKTYYWPEERSACFFAVGRIKKDQRPVAVITTSGTAAAELLPAAMESFYNCFPLLLITADRPRRFKGSNAPQSAEQVGLYGVYTPFSLDLEGEELCSLEQWDRRAPCHINVRLEENYHHPHEGLSDEDFPQVSYVPPPLPTEGHENLEEFFHNTKYPFVIVGGLIEHDQDSVVAFLEKTGIPFYAEGVSGTRENPRLAATCITCVDQLWKNPFYPIDGVLRIGSIPTARLWRDLENKGGEIPVRSVSQHPFSGLSWGSVIHADVGCFFRAWKKPLQVNQDAIALWCNADRQQRAKLVKQFHENPHAEPSLVYRLSQKIPENAQIFLGASLPIREWDMAADFTKPHRCVYANRGVNGIDGTLSTFFGMCDPAVENWAIIGDLTTLYDLAAPWILQQMESMRITIVVINNGGGMIFSKIHDNPAFLNAHGIRFAGLAQLWGMEYECWESVPEVVVETVRGKARLIEVCVRERIGS